MEENVTGVTQTAAGSESSAKCPPPQENQGQKAEAFEKLIKGEYKQAYDERVQETVRKRLKNARAAQDTLTALARKYGLSVEHICQLAEQGNHTAGHSRPAGTPVWESGESGADCRGLQASHAMTREAEQAVKELYPGFRLEREMADPRFAKLVRNGVDLRTAFEVVHRDQILPAAMQAAARAVEKKLTGSAAVSRVAESAMESSSAPVVKTDVAAMTRQQRADIIRRVQRGEKIRF